MFRLIFIAGLLLAPGVADAQNDPALWHLLPPNAKAVISIDWKVLRSSHLGAMLRENFIDSNAGQALPGAEFLNDVDRCIIASSAREPRELTSEPALLIAVRGHFDLAKVRQALADHGAKPQVFNSIQVYRPQGQNNRDMAFVLLDAQTILIGDANSVFASVERNANPAQPATANAIMTRAAEMDARYDAWAVMSGLQTSSGDRLMGLLAGGGITSDTRSVEAGIALRNGLIADLSFIFPSEPEARNMAKGLADMLKAMIQDKVGGAAIVDLEKRAKVTADGSVAKIALRMTVQDLEKNARIFAESKMMEAKKGESKTPAAQEAQARAESTPAQVSQSKSASAANAAAPKTPAKVIRIDGLDDGPREIVMKPENH